MQFITEKCKKKKNKKKQSSRHPRRLAVAHVGLFGASFCEKFSDQSAFAKHAPRCTNSCLEYRGVNACHPFPECNMAGTIWRKHELSCRRVAEQQTVCRGFVLLICHF